MDNLIIEATRYTPRIFFDASRNILEISGKSYPENTSVFYTPVFKWLEEYLNFRQPKEIIVNLDLLYFNSSSSKILMDFCDMLEDAAAEGKKIILNWIYEQDDDDLLEFGEEFQEDYESLTFNLVEKVLS